MISCRKKGALTWLRNCRETCTCRPTWRTCIWAAWRAWICWRCPRWCPSWWTCRTAWRTWCTDGRRRNLPPCSCPRRLPNYRRPPFRSLHEKTIRLFLEKGFNMWMSWDIPSLRNISNTFLTIFLLITFNILCCWRVSRDTFNGRSSLSTI